MKYDLYTLAWPLGTESLTSVISLSSKDFISGIANISGVSKGIDILGISGVIWHKGAVSFVMPAGDESFLFDVNAHGNAVGQRGLIGPQGLVDSEHKIPILVQNGVVNDLDSLLGLGALPTGINDSGLICGWLYNDPRSFIYDSATSTPLTYIDPLPGATKAIAMGINNAGEVIGHCYDRQFYYSKGMLTDLGPGTVMDINDVGQIAGSKLSVPGIWDVKQSPPVFQEIPVPAGFIGGRADSINNKGLVVGTCWRQDTNWDHYPFIYEAGVSTELNTLIPPEWGWHLSEVRNINDYGQIAGTGRKTGKQMGFLLTPLVARPGLPPQPDLPLARRPPITLDEILAVLVFGGVTVDGGGWVLPAGGGPPIPVDPWSPFRADLSPAKRDALIGLALDELVLHLQDPTARESIRRVVLEAVRGNIDQLIETVYMGGTMTKAGPLSGQTAERETLDISWIMRYRSAQHLANSESTDQG